MLHFYVNYILWEKLCAKELFLNLGIGDYLGELAYENICGLITIVGRDFQDDLPKFIVLNPPLTAKS